MRKIDTKNNTAFEYRPINDELGIFYERGGLFYNFESKVFEFCKDPYGRTKKYTISHIEISDDFSQTTFTTKIGSKESEFLIPKSYKLNVILNEFTHHLKTNGFEKSKEDLERIIIYFDKGCIKNMDIIKEIDGKPIDGFSISNHSQLRIGIGIGLPMITVLDMKLEMTDNQIICHADDKVFTYQVDAQACILRIMKKLIVYMCF